MQALIVLGCYLNKDGPAIQLLEWVIEHDEHEVPVKPVRVETGNVGETGAAFARPVLEHHPALKDCVFRPADYLHGNTGEVGAGFRHDALAMLYVADADHLWPSKMKLPLKLLPAVV